MEEKNGFENPIGLVSSIIKVVSLDMDIAISCYMLARSIHVRSTRVMRQKTFYD